MRKPKLKLLLINKDPSKVKIELKLDIVRSLLEMGVDVPNQKVEDIDATIEQLNEKKNEFDIRGQKKMDEIFKYKNWQEEYEKELNRGEENYLLEEEEESEEKPKKVKKQEKYVLDLENDKPLV